MDGNNVDSDAVDDKSGDMCSDADGNLQCLPVTDNDDHGDDVHIDAEINQESTSIPFTSPTVAWQHSMGYELSMMYVSSSQSPWRKVASVHATAPPKEVRRVQGDGACIFRCLAFVGTWLGT